MRVLVLSGIDDPGVATLEANFGRAGRALAAIPGATVRIEPMIDHTLSRRFMQERVVAAVVDFLAGRPSRPETGRPETSLPSSLAAVGGIGYLVAERLERALQRPQPASWRRLPWLAWPRLRMTALAASAHGPLSTHTRLNLLVISVLVPFLAFVGIMLAQFSTSERDRYAGDALAVSRQVSLAVDREIDGLIATLEALATSPAAQDGVDLGGLRPPGARFAAHQGRASIVLRDLSGRELIDTGEPFGAELPVVANDVVLATDRLVLATGRPATSDVTWGGDPGGGWSSSIRPSSRRAVWPIS